MISSNREATLLRFIGKEAFHQDVVLCSQMCFCRTDAAAEDQLD